MADLILLPFLIFMNTLFNILTRKTVAGNPMYLAGISLVQGLVDPVLAQYLIWQCEPECQRRCGDTKYEKPCLFFCRKCCKTCLCVPPGFYRNKEICPCYNSWKTQQGGPKFP
ncbi:hypothetical protein MKX03_003289 [Papaver bracteatum]|nr:hypothetical protein MKX03_003289 [Papaver bracteatum]